MIDELLIAFGMIFFAEMGDKSQMLAMTFASKYKLKYVFFGMFFGILLNHILAIFLGQVIGELLPLGYVSIGAGVLFLLFGFYSLRLDKEEEETVLSKYAPIITVALAFFLGELGDKTQLATFTLASDALYPVFVLIGTVSGMMAVGMLGIYVGMKMGSKIPEELMKLVSALVFVVFGSVKLIGSMPTTLVTFPYIFLYSLLMGVLFFASALPLMGAYRETRLSPFKRSAEQLKVFYSELYERLDGICLGENVCGGCDGKSCLVGYTKLMLKKAKDLKEVDLDYVKLSDPSKPFPQDKLMESLLLVLHKLEHDHEEEQNKILTQLRYNYERLLFEHRIKDYEGIEDYFHKVAYYDKFIAKQLKLNWA